MRDEVARLFLSGDVMLGRGIDQMLPHPGDPGLRERWVDDARTYVQLAEQASGPVPRPVDPSWPWGVALQLLDDAGTDVRVLNLETSVTTSDTFAPDKGIHYRMHPANVAAVTVARPDVCVLANNHVLDFGVPGLVETLDVLEGAGVATAGAGRDRTDAQRPAVVPLPRGGRVLVFAAGAGSAGVPPDWAATGQRPGVDRLDESPGGTDDLLQRVEAWKRPGDLVVASVHWGSNWGYDVPASRTRLAHALVEGGVDVVHGHSSHHPRPVAVHGGRLVLHGCGDLINDYEGIRGHEEFRDELRLLPLVDLDRASGALVALRLVPVVARRLRLEHPTGQEVAWLASTLDAACRPYGTRVGRDGDATLVLRQVQR